MHKETLKEIIQKALNNGWLQEEIDRKLYIHQKADGYQVKEKTGHPKEPTLVFIPFFRNHHILFNHEFAKAYFGFGWDGSLQEAVLEDDIISYYGEYL